MADGCVVYVRRKIDLLSYWLLDVFLLDQSEAPFLYDLNASLSDAANTIKLINKLIY